MDNKEKIYKYLNRIKWFRDIDYEYLVSLYGDELVKEVLLEAFRNYDLDICSKVKVEGHNHLLSNNVLIEITSELIKDINSILISLGYVDKKFLKKMLEDKISVVLSECNDIESVNRIRELYKKFVYFRNMLCQCNLSLVVVAIRGADNPSIYDDLYQEGFMRLMRAVEEYDSSRGTKFSTYAFTCIGYAIKDHKYDYKFSLTLSRVRINIYHNMLMLQEMSDKVLDNKEIASQLGIAESRLLKYLDINNFLANDKDYRVELRQVPDGDIYDRTLENQIIYGNLDASINELLLELDDRDRLLLEYRFLGDKIRTFSEVAELMGLSRQTVNVECRKILKLLRIRGRDLKRFY